MKLKSFITTFTLLFAFVVASFATNVDQATAERVAKNTYYQQANAFETPIGFDEIIIKNIYLDEVNGIPVMYVVEFEGGGFALISAQDAMVPVLGFNFTKEAKYGSELRNPAYEFFIGEMKALIVDLVDSQFEQKEDVARQWQMMNTTNVASLIPTTKDDVEVGPFLSTTWNQSAPYNYYAPPGCPAGCVATAMAVVMHYYQWPDIGVGSHSYNDGTNGVQSADFEEAPYNYELMPNSISASNSEEVIKECARIQRHTGVAMNMMYSPDGSGAYSNQVPSRLSAFFKYPNVTYEQKNYMSVAAWEALLKQQLDAGYVLYHSGQDPERGGHAWNCDGYRTIAGETTYHHNFNWGGSDNGWYTHADPSGFSSSQGILKNFYPTDNQYPMYASGHRVLTEKYGRIQDGSGPIRDYLSGTAASWLIAPELEHDSIENITLTWEKLELGSGDYIRVYDGTDATGTLVQELTAGSELPTDYISTGNTLFVDFQSTGSAPGFIFTYTAKRQSFCNSMTNITNKLVTIESNPEDKYYNPNTMCRWVIRIPNTTGGKIDFDYVDTFDEEDYVQLLDQGNSQEIGKYYGQDADAPQNISIGPNGVVIVFKTNNFDTQGKGFKLTYEDETLGLEDAFIGGVSVYPNPAKGSLNVVLDNEIDQASMQVINVTGAVLHTKEFAKGTAKYETIDVSNYPVGVYFVKVTTTNGIITNKIVIE
ncbi:MAG: C10 family peptidase [Lentimicrobiaceae bacterium]|jgi:hypothetical protein|nr:C10 family peptidase [Lentimicrobiaceae bacterium]